MPRYLIERRFDEDVELPAADIAVDGVTWLHSYVSGERKTAFDLYEAPSPEAVRRAAGRSRLPIDQITEVRVLDPHGYERRHT
jgi:Nickel responsive protein SCO4226-like